MSNLLDRMNKALSETIEGNEVAKGLAESKLDIYKGLFESGSVFSAAFASVGRDGTFSIMDEDVEVILSADKFGEVATSTNTYATKNLLGVSMQVKVCEICVEEKKVYVELAGATKESYTANLREEINNELSRSVYAGKNPVVWGRVVRVNRDKMVIDILDKGINGFLGRKHWSKDFYRSLESVANVGDYFQFEVVGKAPKLDGKPVAWILSRQNITKSVWDDLNLEGLEEKGVLLVRCVEKPEGKTYWWGVSDRLPGVELMGDYSSSFRTPANLYEGITYKCKIKRLDLEKKQIKVVPFEVAAADYVKVAKVKAFKNGKTE